MTKRFNNFGQNNNKKPKLDDDIEALWGDDVDENALDDCIKLASQICQEERITCTQLNNVTVLPTYSAFKEKKTFFHSTQFEPIVTPSTSKYEPYPKKRPIDEHLENEMKRLRQQYEEKEGEVSILRSQLQETKTSVQIENQKIHSEWKQKLSLTEKQMKSVKSELDFKNLEISNLKQKVLAIKKHNKLDITLSSTQDTSDSKTKNDNRKVEKTIQPKLIKLEAILDAVYPLKGIVPNFIFNIPKREQHIIEKNVTHICRNTIPYLQNQMVSSNIAIDRSEIGINCVYPELLKLMYCTQGELNLEKNIVNINKIICTCEQFLDDLQKFLNQIKSNLRTEDILEADSIFLKYQDSVLHFNNRSCDRDEIGMKCGVLLNFIAELLPYSDYLREHICQDKELYFQQPNYYTKMFPYRATMKESGTPNFLLNTLLSTVKIAAEIRKTHFMTNFLCSTITLLTNICKSRNYDYVSDIFCKITKELILSRPTVMVICQLTLLFKVASHCSSFVEFLLNKSQNSITSKKGILYFNEGACRFYVFVMLFDNGIFKLKNEEFPFDVFLNMLCFMYNTFKTSHWIHHQDTRECECVAQLHKLVVELVFRTLEIYTGDKEMKRRSDWDRLFKSSIISKVLSLMTFNSYELTEKFITVFSQYKEIERRLQEEDGLDELERLNINEEDVEISSNAFANVKF